MAFVTASFWEVLQVSPPISCEHVRTAFCSCKVVGGYSDFVLGPDEAAHDMLRVGEYAIELRSDPYSPLFYQWAYIS